MGKSGIFCVFFPNYVKPVKNVNFFFSWENINEDVNIHLINWIWKRWWHFWQILWFLRLHRKSAYITLLLPFCYFHDIISLCLVWFNLKKPIKSYVRSAGWIHRQSWKTPNTKCFYVQWLFSFCENCKQTTCSLVFKNQQKLGCGNKYTSVWKINIFVKLKKSMHSVHCKKKKLYIIPSIGIDMFTRRSSTDDISNLSGTK